VLISSAGKMRATIKASRRNELSYGPTTAALGKVISDGVSLAVTGSPSSMRIGPTLESFGCPANAALLAQIDAMQTITISCTATTDLEATISFIASDAEQAAKMTATGTTWLAAAPQSVRNAFRTQFPDTPLPGAFDRFLESAEWATARTVNRIRLRAQRRDIGGLIELYHLFGGDTKPIDDGGRGRRIANSLATLFASGIAAGNIDLPKAGSVEKAIEMLTDGVRGEGEFSTTEIKFADKLSEIDLDAISRYLVWEDDLLVYRDPSPAQIRRP